MPTRTRAPRRRGNLAPVAFVAPFLLLFLLTFAAPIGYAVFQSVMDVERTGPLGLGVSRTVFVGLSNYSDALSDDAFVRQTTPLGREQTPEDIGEAVVYLCRADNVTGVALNVAGGVEMH